METFLPDTVKLILLVLLGLGFGLSLLARALPQVAWLQAFRLPKLSEAERERQRRCANRRVGIEIVFTGFALPFLYVISQVMLFNEPKTGTMTIVITCSVLLVVLGIWLYVRNR